MMTMDQAIIIQLCRINAASMTDNSIIAFIHTLFEQAHINAYVENRVLYIGFKYRSDVVYETHKFDMDYMTKENGTILEILNL